MVTVFIPVILYLMTVPVNPSRRRYDSSGRRARARQTRAEICDAARRLFEQNGYAHTTIADIARAADVSAETIYKAFGSKAALLGAVVTAAIRGDTDATPLRRRPAIDAIRREQDPRRKIAMYARLLAEVNPRLAPLVRVMREAAPGDPQIAVALARLNANRLDGMSEFAALLKACGALRPDVAKRDARDVLWTLNSPELYELLVLERGWSPRRYGHWVGEQLAAALLA
jgi:AcrR family transcriptional regulator